MSLEKDFFTHLFYKKIFFYTSNENVCIAMIKKKGEEDIRSNSPQQESKKGGSFFFFISYIYIFLLRARRYKTMYTCKTEHLSVGVNRR